MADLESFLGVNEGGEAMDPAAFERFKERMGQAAAQLKAIQAQEQKQKKKEDELVKILIKFIQSGQQKYNDIMLLLARLLEQNVPAPFLLSVLLVNQAEIQKELGIKLLPPENIQTTGKPTLPDKYMPDQSLPLQLKIAIDAWIHEMIRYAAEKPERLLKTAIDENGVIKLALKQLAVLCLQDFLLQNQIQTGYEQLKGFMEIMLEGILKKTREDFRNRKKIENKTEKPNK